MALCAQKSAVCGTTAPRNSRRVLARPVRAAVDYQAPSTRTGANELEALARMSNLVSWQGSKWKGGKGEGVHSSLPVCPGTGGEREARKEVGPEMIWHDTGVGKAD